MRQRTVRFHRRSRQALPRRSLRAVLVVAALALVAAAALGCILLLQQTPAQPTPLDVSPYEAAVPFAGGYLQLHNDKLMLHHPDGSSEVFADSFSAARLVANSRFVACFSETKIHVFNTDGKRVLEREFTPGAYTIAGVRLGQQRFGVLIQTYDGQTSIRLYNANGSTASVPEVDFGSKTVVDFGFYGQPACLWVSQLDTAATTYTTRITLYDNSQTLVGNITLYGEVVTAVHPMQKDVLVVGTSHCLLYDYGGTLLKETSIHGWYPVGTGGSDPEAPKVVLVPQGTQNDQANRPQQIIWIHDPHGEDLTVTPPQDASFAAAGEKAFWLISGDTLLTYRYNGTAGRQLDCQMAVSQLQTVPGSPRLGIARAGDQLYFLTLPN